MKKWFWMAGILACGVMCELTIPPISLAIVRVESAPVAQSDEVVKGRFEGYRNHTLNLSLPDGTGRGYPCEERRELLHKIGRIPKGANVQLIIKQGVVVGVEVI